MLNQVRNKLFHHQYRWLTCTILCSFDPLIDFQDRDLNLWFSSSSNQEIVLSLDSFWSIRYWRTTSGATIRSRKTPTKSIWTEKYLRRSRPRRVAVDSWRLASRCFIDSPYFQHCALLDFSSAGIARWFVTRGIFSSATWSESNFTWIDFIVPLASTFFYEKRYSSAVWVVPNRPF